MVLIRIKAVVISGCMFLGLGLAADYILAADQSDRRQGKEDTHEAQTQTDQAPHGKTIKGEVVRVDGEKWFIKDERGKEIQLHVDQTTRRSPQKGDDKNLKGTSIEAMVNDSNHALSISSPDRRDDRHDHSTSNAGEKK